MHFFYITAANMAHPWHITQQRQRGERWRLRERFRFWHLGLDHRLHPWCYFQGGDL